MQKRFLWIGLSILLCATCLFAGIYIGKESKGHNTIDKRMLDNIPKMTDIYNECDADIPWIEEREPIICLWKTNVPRGQYYNTNASLASEIMSYSDAELFQYVKLMKYCGFTGIQVTYMCSTWAQYGGYEFVEDRIRVMADAAHALDMNFTLWVWGAEFEGYGWIDTSVVYHDYAVSPYAYDSEAAIATFDKYYSIYARLADCSDRIIVHYDDPSNIHDSTEVAYFAKMLRDKVREVNPKIKFGVSDYTDKYDKTVLKEYLGDDFTVYCGANIYKDKTWANFRSVAASLDIDLGVWSWNLIEMEIDQLAEMNVNPKIIKRAYKQSQAEDYICKPTYWSEMDSYHLLNVFSLYTAGRLLINPDLDEEALLKQICLEMVGDKYGNDLFEVTSIIEDARSGSTFEEFKIGYDEYLLTSEAYETLKIKERCEKIMPIFDTMIKDTGIKCKVPLPIEVNELLALVRPHLQQIYEFSCFRAGLDDINASLSGGASKEEIQKSIDELYDPISNYNCVIGVWGQPEALAQYKLLYEFCNNNDFVFPEDGLFTYYQKQYIYEEMLAMQKNSKELVTFPHHASIIWEAILGHDIACHLVDLLYKDGLLEYDNDEYYLKNWEDYAFVLY